MDRRSSTPTARCDDAVRRKLDALYDAAAYLAALFLIGTLLMVLLGIFGRLLAFQVRGTDAYAGYLMAGAGFLALAHTLMRGEHIRVTLVLEHAGIAGKRWLDRWSLAIALVLSVAFAWYSIRLAWQSYAFHDMSTGNDATPLWIPQLSMAAGNVILAIAFVDLLLGAIYGGRAPATRVDEPAHIE
jgi:TRAP-type C4-dicarboxylate transport system permease small subunit